MPRLLILLTLPPDVTEQYRARLSKLFPELTIDVVSQREKAEPALRHADILLTFGQMMKNLKLGLDGATSTNVPGPGSQNCGATSCAAWSGAPGNREWDAWLT